MTKAKRLGASVPHASFRNTVSKKAREQMFQMLRNWSLDMNNWVEKRDKKS